MIECWKRRFTSASTKVNEESPTTLKETLPSKTAALVNLPPLQSPENHAKTNALLSEEAGIKVLLLVRGARPLELKQVLALLREASEEEVKKASWEGRLSLALAVAKDMDEGVARGVGRDRSDIDVYGFGAFLLELLTGKSYCHVDVVEMRSLLQSGEGKVLACEEFDREMLRCEIVEEEMVDLLRLGVQCLDELKFRRPRSMSAVVEQIEQITRFSRPMLA